jgi:hypothetical protein
VRFAPWLICAWLVAAASAVAQEPEPQPDPDPDAESVFAPAMTPNPGSMLPSGPVKPLVLGYCDKCHGLAWIERSGGSLDGWTSRLYRMNRAGAMVPVEQIPVIAEYLAQALPERPRPTEPPKKRSGPSFSSSPGESP